MQNQQELSTLPLPPNYQSKLLSAGYLVVDDLKSVKPSELSRDLEISHEAAVEIVSCVRHRGNPNATSCNILSAMDLLLREQNIQSIVTFSADLDSMLNGGVPLGKITEFCGAPGIGKTQMCMQLAVDVQIPECYGGVQGEAVYIDTEGSFMAERLQDIAEVTVRHCLNLDTEGESPVAFTTDKVLQGVHYYRCRDYVELLAILHLLPTFIKDHPKTKLVIVDSIAFHFRHGFDDLSLRTRLLTSIAQTLVQIASHHQLAVVLTNQMTTRVSSSSSNKYDFMSALGDPSLSMVPALGESWAHISTIRLILFWQQNQRKALLYKSPEHKEDVTTFQITMGGIRDVLHTDPAAMLQGNEEGGGGSNSGGAGSGGGGVNGGSGGAGSTGSGCGGSSSGSGVTSGGGGGGGGGGISGGRGSSSSGGGAENKEVAEPAMKRQRSS